MTRRIVATFTIICATAVGVIGVNAAGADNMADADRRGGPGSGCEDGHSCVWSGTGYESQKVKISGQACCDWDFVVIGQGIQSAKNRFANRMFMLRRGNDTGTTRCINPGGNRPSLDTPGIDNTRVGGLGSRCGD